jgi:hypothetical protein
MGRACAASRLDVGDMKDCVAACDRRPQASRAMFG